MLLSYIVFLHQTTTDDLAAIYAAYCLISSFYIKPQQTRPYCSTKQIVLYRLSTSNHNSNRSTRNMAAIVLYRLSTSNHNEGKVAQFSGVIVLYRLSTSNHNFLVFGTGVILIVLYRLSTSNHNLVVFRQDLCKLSYIVFLHQTTTC